MPPLKNFTKKAHESIRSAHELAVERGQNHVTPLHLLTSLILQDESMVISIIDKIQIDHNSLIDTLLELIEGPDNVEVLSPSYQMYLSPELAQVLENATRVASSFEAEFVSTEHLFLSLLDIKSPAKNVLGTLSIDRDKVVNIIKDLKNNKSSDDIEVKKFKTLRKYTNSLTDAAKRNELDPVIGRDKEINRIIQILSRRTKNNTI